jgi:hypothetical protein
MVTTQEWGDLCAAPFFSGVGAINGIAQTGGRRRAQEYYRSNPSHLHGGYIAANATPRSSMICDRSPP